ncbi:MAG: L-histidine N(alpha)-methyltransferase [Cyanobacteria bacterium HKST-UBA06]|nr:L-histidine N(alpha)-methyltransferase [Cyanobacteria bacterium HKST-UBA06]
MSSPTAFCACTATEHTAKAPPTTVIQLPQAATDRAAERRQIWAGLSAAQPEIDSRYFYDAHGSQLYEAITQTRAYYPTRTEAGILRALANDLPQRVRFSQIVELGSGSSAKTRILFDALQRQNQAVHYWPIDVSHRMLEATATALAHQYDTLSVTGLAGDYAGALKAWARHPKAQHGGPALFMFLGGTIGNFDATSKSAFIDMLHGHMRPGDAMLAGFDRAPHASKPVWRIEQAYNDEAGLTAAFNLNCLTHLNRILDSDFDNDGWQHQAFYNTDANQIEMHLLSRRQQTVHSPYFETAPLTFAQGTTIRTEISRKFHPAPFTAPFTEAGFKHLATFEDTRQYFGVLMLLKKP